MSTLSLQAEKLFKSGKLWLESEQPDSDWTAPPLLVTVLSCWIAFNWATSIRIGQPSVDTWTDSIGSAASWTADGPWKSEDRRVGNDCVTTCRSWWSQSH